MQQKDMAEKRRIYVDNEELLGLVKIDEYKRVKGTIEVPEFSRTRVIENAIVKITPLGATFKIQRNSATLKILNSWFDNNETHDVIMERTDAHGNVFETVMYPDCSLGESTIPAYDAASPTYAQIPVQFIPWNFDHRSS